MQSMGWNYLISLHFRQSFSCRGMQICNLMSFLIFRHMRISTNISRDGTKYLKIYPWPSWIFTNISRDGTMARLLMAIVVVFLCCHSTKIIVNFYEAIQVKTTKSWQFWTNRILLHIQDGAARRAGAPDLGDDAGQSEPPPLDHQLRH